MEFLYDILDFDTAYKWENFFYVIIAIIFIIIMIILLFWIGVLFNILFNVLFNVLFNLSGLLFEYLSNWYLYF